MFGESRREVYTLVPWQPPYLVKNLGGLLMSRPKKAVADYFPHYVNHGKTMYTIENKYGNNGYAFWFKLLEQLGGAEHHYLDCNDTGTWEFILAKSKINSETAISILDTCSSLGAINQDLWKYKIIRSDNLIANLSSLYSRREIMVMGNEEVLGLCNQKSHSSSVSSNKNPQSEVNNSQVNLSIKMETESNEQKQGEGISKGNPRISKNPAVIPNSRVKHADYERGRVKGDSNEIQQNPSAKGYPESISQPAESLVSKLMHNFTSDGNPPENKDRSYREFLSEIESKSEANEISLGNPAGIDSDSKPELHRYTTEDIESPPNQSQLYPPPPVSTDGW